VDRLVWCVMRGQTTLRRPTDELIEKGRIEKGRIGEGVEKGE